MTPERRKLTLDGVGQPYDRVLDCFGESERRFDASAGLLRWIVI